MRNLIDQYGPRERNTRLTCLFCGQPFLATKRTIPLYCSHTCQQKEWRAVTMLAGTHGYVGGKWQRLPQQG